MLWPLSKEAHKLCALSYGMLISGVSCMDLLIVHHHQIFTTEKELYSFDVFFCILYKIMVLCIHE